MNRMFYIGIDVSKGYADYVILNQSKKIVGDYSTVYDTGDGYDEMEQCISKLYKQYKPVQIVAAVESTGGIENNWLNFLYSLRDKYSLKVARLNPNVIYQYQKTDLKETKTDRTSSLAIAAYLATYLERVNFYEPDRYKSIRDGATLIQLMLRQRTQYINSLRLILYEVFPQILPYCKYDLSKSTLKLLLLYPSAAHMARAKFSKKSPVTYYTLKVLNDIRDSCKQRVLKDVDEIATYQVTLLAKEILRLNGEIESFYKKLTKRLPVEHLERIKSIPGIAERSAVNLLSVIGDINRFDSAEKMVSYFGLYPVLSESGDLKKRPKLCKKGNKLVRKTLFLCVLNAIKRDPYWIKLYQRLLDRGKSKMSAICALMAKMLRIIFGVLNNGTMYDPLIDMAYRDRVKPAPKEKSSDEIEQNVEEVQKVLKHAPISKKHAKLIKEQTELLTRTQGSEHPDCSLEPISYGKEK